MIHILFKIHLPLTQFISILILGVSSNLDFYSQLADQFASESYGDLLFSLYLVLLLAMKQPTSYRKMLWTEKSECIKLVRLRPEHVAPLHISHWTTPLETDVGVLMAQFRAVMSDEISATSSPFLFQVAMAHLRALMTNETELKDPELNRFKQFVKIEVDKKSKLKELFY